MRSTSPRSSISNYSGLITGAQHLASVVVSIAGGERAARPRGSIRAGAVSGGDVSAALGGNCNDRSAARAVERVWERRSGRSPGFRRRAGTPPVRPFPAVRPTVTIRPTEASKAAVCYVRNTSIRDIQSVATNVRNGSIVTVGRTAGTGGEQAYSGRLRKARSSGESRHSIASPK